MVRPIFKEVAYETTKVVAYETALGSMGATLASMALDSPLGLQGAVVLGTIRVISRCFITVGSSLLDSSSLSIETAQAIKIAFVVAGLFATSAIVWKALAIAGIALTFKQVVVLYIGTNIARQAIAISANFVNLTRAMWQGSAYEDNSYATLRISFA